MRTAAAQGTGTRNSITDTDRENPKQTCATLPTTARHALSNDAVRAHGGRRPCVSSGTTTGRGVAGFAIHHARRHESCMTGDASRSCTIMSHSSGITAGPPRGHANTQVFTSCLPRVRASRHTSILYGNVSDTEDRTNNKQQLKNYNAGKLMEVKK